MRKAMLVDIIFDRSLLEKTKHGNKQLINWWKKWIDFEEIKLWCYFNENIEWNCMHLEFNFNSILLNVDSMN
jgi:hypothetical protein